MNFDDFRYMWRGKTQQALSNQQAALLAPIDHQNGKKERALLLLHGFSSSPAVFRELLPTLFNLYDTVVCPALPGHADSIETFAKTQASEWLTAAEQSCEELLRNYQMVDVMGLSLGGLLACHLANRFPLHHLYLLAPALALRFKITIALAVARLLHGLGFRRLRNRAGNLYTSRASELAYRQLPISTIIEILSLIQNYQFVPPTCPVDLFLGRYDEVVQSTLVADYFANLPNVHIHWLNHSAHVLPLDGDIDTIIAHLKGNQAKITQATS
ncbi:alpha/beta hydrolase [Legionella oakridgensis]|uniref:Esterase/lipase n=2 Tax=Legionella oakridgensis TaxID=29423 RepID=W0BI08_9GAMM|nr:alpha/beta fold hydrolase [Legionella oakridgensis]AHE68316.1 esterase/lipase [Legionella oakridgensis ATCC 33761 = DSM 21215]ETO92234.1 esterase/lipase [Legionella oakridgensis RV-2-2007]KTD39009.1 carboxylesterase [Legionella oakridgensis]STY21263.1 carboxylesterase [Legionella longbeachae]